MSGGSINLLPKSRQVQLKFRLWYVIGWRAYLVSAMSFVVVALALVGGVIYLDLVTRSLEVEANALKQQTDSKDNAELKKQVGVINGRIADYNVLAESLPKWSLFLSRFAAVVPEGVQIQSLSVDSASRQVRVQGFAPTRELAIALHDLILAESSSFADIDYPLENVSRPEEVNFHYTFSVKEEVLK